MDLETQKQALIELLLLGAEQIRLEKYRDMEQVFEDFEHLDSY